MKIDYPHWSPQRVLSSAVEHFLHTDFLIGDDLERSQGSHSEAKYRKAAGHPQSHPQSYKNRIKPTPRAATKIITKMTKAPGMYLSTDGGVADSMDLEVTPLPYVLNVLAIFQGRENISGSKAKSRESSATRKKRKHDSNKGESHFGSHSMCM